MAELVTLTEDGALGAAGTQVWVNEPADVGQKAAPEKKPATKKTADKPDKI